MKSYKAPGIYSTFVPAVETVNGGRALRRLAIVGSGQKFFTRENVAVRRSNSTIFDELEDDGVIEITRATSCKFKNGKLVYNDEKHYTNFIVKDGKIVWLPSDEEGNISEEYLIPARCFKELYYETEGSKILMDDGLVDIQLAKDKNGKVMETVLEDTDYVLLVNNTEKIGTFTIENITTGELIGEYNLTETTMGYREDIIPGLKIKVVGTAIDEESGEYLFGEKVAVGDAIKICVRAPKNRAEAKAFLNFFAAPRDVDGNVVVDAEKLAKNVYSKTNMDGIAFSGTNGGLKVVDGDPADATEIKKDVANANRKAGEAAFEANDYVGRVPGLVLEGKDVSTELYKLSNGEYTVEVAPGANQLNIKYSRELFAGYNDNAEKICKYDAAALAQYNVDNATDYELDNIKFNSRGEEVPETAPTLKFEVKFADTADKTKPVEGLKAGNIEIRVGNQSLLNPSDPDKSNIEVSDIKMFRKDKDGNETEVPEIPAGLEFVLTYNNGSGEVKTNYNAADPTNKFAKFAADLKEILTSTADKTGLEIGIDLINPLAIISINELDNYIKDIEIVKESKLTDGDYVVEYVSGITPKTVAIRVSKIVPKLNADGLIEENLIPASATLKVSTFKNGVISSIIPGVKFTLNAKDITDAIAATPDPKIKKGDILGIISTRPVTFPSGQPADGDVYYISYKYRRTDFSPRIFTQYEDIVATYGNYNVALNGYVSNGVTLAAQLAMQNGAEEVIISQVESDTNQGFKDAIDKLANIDENIVSVDIIVPLTTDYEVIQHLSDHVTLYSSDEYCLYRMGYVGASKDEPIDSDAKDYEGDKLGSIQKTMAIKNERMVYVVPGTIQKTVINPITGYSVVRTLPAPYAAAAVAGLAMRNDLAEPLTNKIVYGIDSLGTIYQEVDANKLANAGCLVLKQDKNEIRVRHGITTFYEFQTFNDVHSNEITFIQIKDRVISLCRSELGRKYVGNKLKTSILNDIEYTLTQLLNTLAAAETIIGYEGVSVTRDIDNPMQVNIKFFIEAVYPLNFLEVEFGFSTTISE